MPPYLHLALMQILLKQITEPNVIMWALSPAKKSIDSGAGKNRH